MAVPQRKPRQTPRAAIGVGIRPERLEDRTLLSTINWINEGNASNDSDGFGAVFGESAGTARKIIEQALGDWQSVIGDFNNGSDTMNITVSMSTGTGFGAAAGGNTQSNGQPTGGYVTLNSGQNGHGSGWFLDPTPGEDSEFRGNIINAYAADAPSTSPAFGKYDLYTVVVLETAHILGLNDWTGENFAADPNGYLTNTGRQDAAVGSGEGILWTYNGPDVQALFTSDNAGTESRAHALHTAEPNAGNLVTSDGVTYYGAQDSENAFFEKGRRYLPSDLDALVMKDSYGYAINTPVRNMYATLDSTRGDLLLRGGQTGQTTYFPDHAQSNDNISVDTISPTLPSADASEFVSTGVQIGKWVEGTGPQITLHNLWPLTGVNSITVDTGQGSDTVNIARVPAGVPVSVTSAGVAAVTVGNSTTGLAEILGPVSIQNSSDDQTSAITLDDSADTAPRSITLDTFTPAGDTPWQRVSGLAPADISYRASDDVTIDGGSGGNTTNVTGIVPFTGDSGGIDLNTGAGDDVITITGTAPGMRFNINGQDGNDTLTVDFSSGNVAGGMTITFDGGNGIDNLTIAGQSPGTAISVNAGHLLDGTSSVNYTATVESLTLDPAMFTILDDLNGVFLSTADAGTVVNINVTQHLSALNVGNFTTVKLAGGTSPGTVRVVTRSLSIGSLAARLDLTNNSLQIDYGAGPDPILAVQNLIGTAYAGGDWSGPGITTTKGDGTHALGLGDSTDGIVSGLQDNSILIKYTVSGDLNLDGRVNFNDLLALAQRYGCADAHWDQGDLNYDGSVSFIDLLRLAQNYNGALSAGAQQFAAAALPPRALPITPVRRRRH